MTATEPHAALAAPPVPPPAGELPGVEDAERRPQLLQALTHRALHPADRPLSHHHRRQWPLSAVLEHRPARWSAQPSLLPVRLALLPALVLLGILTYLRLVQTAVEDLFYARAINRIRRHHVDLDPETSHWFMLCGFGDPAGVMVEKLHRQAQGRYGPM